MTILGTPGIMTIFTIPTTDYYISTSTDSSSQANTAVAVEPATSFSFQTIAPYVYAFIGCVGIVANAFVAIIIATSPTLRKRFENSLLFNQSLIDGVTGLLLLASLTGSLHITQTGWFWEFICRYWMSSTPLFAALQASICNLVVITIERYIEIVHPIAHKARCNVQRD